MGEVGVPGVDVVCTTTSVLLGKRGRCIRNGVFHLVWDQCSSLPVT